MSIERQEENGIQEESLDGSGKPSADASRSPEPEVQTAMQRAREVIQAFANKHKVIFQDHGEVGFGRPCVGLETGDKYINYRPTDSQTWEVLPGFDGEFVPDGVEDSYHKHECVAVLVHGGDYDKAIIQLHTWVNHLEALGVELATYETGATGIQALFSGVTAKAFRITNRSALRPEGPGEPCEPEQSSPSTPHPQRED